MDHMCNLNDHLTLHSFYPPFGYCKLAEPDEPVNVVKKYLATKAAEETKLGG